LLVREEILALLDLSGLLVLQAQSLVLQVLSVLLVNPDQEVHRGISVLQVPLDLLGQLALMVLLVLKVLLVPKALLVLKDLLVLVSLDRLAPLDLLVLLAPLEDSFLGESLQSTINLK
jgi:hypothetical protein